MQPYNTDDYRILKEQRHHLGIIFAHNKIR